MLLLLFSFACFSNFPKIYLQKLALLYVWSLIPLLCCFPFLFSCFILASLGSPSYVCIACWLASDWTEIVLRYLTEISLPSFANGCVWTLEHIQKSVNFHAHVSFYFPSGLLISPSTWEWFPSARDSRRTYLALLQLSPLWNLPIQSLAGLLLASTRIATSGLQSCVFFPFHLIPYCYFYCQHHWAGVVAVCWKSGQPCWRHSSWFSGPAPFWKNLPVGGAGGGGRRGYGGISRPEGCTLSLCLT